MAGSETSIACPACHASFTQAAPSRSQRVQCPRCRQVVTLPSAPAEPLIDGVWQARIELLEARIHTLEQTLTELAASALPRAPFRWIAPSTLVDFSDAHVAILRDNLSKVPPYEIAIQALRGNERAGWIRAAFHDARWTVIDRAQSALTIPEKSLAIATSLPVSPAMSAAYLALHASGFALRPLFIPQGDEHLIVA